jgi:hypothetical protein
MAICNVDEFIEMLQARDRRLKRVQEATAIPRSNAQTATPLDSMGHLRASIKKMLEERIDALDDAEELRKLYADLENMLPSPDATPATEDEIDEASEIDAAQDAPRDEAASIQRFMDRDNANDPGLSRETEAWIRRWREFDDDAPVQRSRTTEARSRGRRQVSHDDWMKGFFGRD